MDLIDVTKAIAVNALEWKAGAPVAWNKVANADRTEAVAFANKQMEILRDANLLVQETDDTYPAEIRRAMETACGIVGLEYEKVRNKRRARRRTPSLVRTTCVWIGRKVIYPTPSFKEVAVGVFGAAHHSTVIYRVQEFRNDVDAQRLAAQVCSRMGLTKEYVAAMQADGLVPLAVS